MNTTFIKTQSRRFSFTKKILCASALLLGSNMAATAQWVKVGTGTTSNTSATYPTPFGNKNAGQKAQYIFRPSELRAAGIKPGWIDSLGFLVTNTNSAIGHTSLKFYVGSPKSAGVKDTLTGALPATGAWEDLPLRFYDPAIAYLPVTGWNDFKFTTPYYWNGIDNIVVGTCFWSGLNNVNASTEFTTGLYSGASRTHTAPAASATGIAICDAITGATSNVPTSRPNIRFRAYSDTLLTKPTAGTPVSTVKEFCVKNDSMTLYLTGTRLTFGLSFQWQSRTSLTGTWADMAPASSTDLSIKAIQTVSTYYRCIVKNYASLSDTSAVLYVPQAAPFNCDCISESKDNTKEKVLNVNLEAIASSTPCTGITGYYTDSTKGIPAELEPGTEYTLRLRLGSCDTFNRNRAVRVFIDYNQNTDYDISEMVYANAYSNLQPNPQNAVGTFTVPLTARKGLTTMRIVYGQGVIADIAPCGIYNFGETQDYGIKILDFGKPQVTGRLTVCEHDSVVMNAFSVADTPLVFSWTGPGGFTATGPKITFVDAAPSLSGTYYVTVTSGGRTSTPLAVLVTVYPKPGIPNVLNQNMCQYESDGTLKTDGKNVLWYNVPVGGFGDTVAPKLPTHTPNTATFYITQTVNGCVSDRGKVVTNVLLKPGPPAVKSPVTYCQLQTPELVATGDNLKWYLDSAGGVASTISPIPPTGFPDVVYYYVSQTVNGCESDRARIAVIIYEQPNGSIYQSKPFVCQYDTASFIYFGNAPASYDYKWFSTDATYVSGGGQGPVTYRFNEDGDKIVNLYVNNGKCATFKLTNLITVRTAPTAFIDTNKNACVNVPVTISMDSATNNIEKYVWNWAGGQLVSETENGGPYNLVWNTSGIKTIGLVVYHRTCPSLPITKNIDVHEKPYAKIMTIQKVTDFGMDTAVLDGKICSNDTLIFTAWNFSNDDYRFKWSPDQYFDVDTDYVAWDRISKPAFIRVDVVDRFGCESSDSLFVNAEACCELNFPNAFTPNNDGRNDRFHALSDGRQEFLAFRIFNRWGQIVFESGSSDTQGWDGTFAGKPQDMGVYQYYIKYRCLGGQTFEKKGDVTLIR